MQKSTRLVGALIALALPLVLPAFAQDPPPTEPVPTAEPVPAADPHAWPRVFEGDGLKLTVYQPHLESWDYFQLSARAAVSVETAAGAEPVFGVVWLAARTHVNKEQRLVTCEELTLPRASFPTAPDQQETWLAALRTHFPGGVRTWHLDRLEAALAVLRAEKRATAAPIKNDPPRIIFSEGPSILVLVDGVPVLQPAPSDGLLRLVNTRGLVLQEPSTGRYYLAIADRWLVAQSLNGTWSYAANVPAGANAIRDAAVTAGEVDLFDQDQEIKTNLASGVAPKVYTSSEPAELIETQGAADLVPIQGTNLRWTKNTTGDLFVDSSNVQYVLISGRWFRAASREGPWTYVAGSDLPADFRQIPASDPACEVLTSVPGTPAAEEAAIENDVPQSATVRRADATIEVTYDGEPELQPIEGTTCRYVTNCQTPIVVVNEDYYACHDGIWFTCHGPRGRWLCADAVPPVIYTIPPSCPIHYVTYTRIYRSTPEYVYCGYTPGYLGTCVSHDGCVVWGTGFRHRPWVGKVWIGRPCTYGFAVGVHTCSTGFGVGIGVGVRVANRPWWGPLSKPHPVIDEARRDGHRDIHYNNADVYRHWNAAVVRPAEQPMREHREERRDERAAARPNNVYAMPDGRVARRASDGSWEHQIAGTWQRPEANASAPQRPEHQQQQRQLEAEHDARERGAARVQAQQQPRSAPEPRREEPRRQEPRENPPQHPSSEPQPRHNPEPQPRHNPEPQPQHPNPPSHTNPPPHPSAPVRAPSPSPAPGVRGGSTRHGG